MKKFAAIIICLLIALPLYASDWDKVDGIFGIFQSSDSSGTVIDPATEDKQDDVITELQTNIVVSAANSTTTPLLGTASAPADVFTGTAIDMTPYVSGIVSIFADQDSATGGLAIQYSSDGTNWDHADGHVYTITANVGRGIEFGIEAKYVRIVYTNGASAQGTFRMQTLLSKGGVNLHIHAIEYVIDGSHPAPIGRSVIVAKNPSGAYGNINRTAGGNLKISLEEYDAAIIAAPVPVRDPALELSKGNIAGHSVVLKFGKNPDVDSEEDIWDAGGMYGFYPTEAIDVDCDSTGADNGNLTIFGLDGTGALQSETITLTNTTEVNTANAYWRIYRLINTGTADFVGTVTCQARETAGGVSDNTEAARILVGDNQTLMAVYTIPINKTAYMIQYSGSIDSPAGSVTSADMRLYIRPATSVSARTVFLLKNHQGMVPDGTSHFLHRWGTPLKIDAFSDVVLRGSSTGGTGVDMHGDFDLILVDN